MRKGADTRLRWAMYEKGSLRFLFELFVQPVIIGVVIGLVLGNILN